MLKKLLSAFGIGVGLAYSYYRGYWDGFEKARLIYFDEEEVVMEDENEDGKGDIDSSEENTADESSSKDEDSEQVECEDDDCTESFDSEQGMKIHFGRVHKSDED